MPWWILELHHERVLIAIALWLGPFIKRFGRAYAADVFHDNPQTGKSYIVLTDIVYYLMPAPPLARLLGVRRPLIGALVVLLAGVAVAPLTVSRASVPALERSRPVVQPERHQPPATPWGPTRAEVRKARSLVGELTLAELAGQVVVAGYRGTGSPAAMVRRLHLGGVVPVAENITSSAQIAAVNASVQRAVRGRGYPAFIGVDQEGGTVVRIRDAATRFPSFMSTGAARDPQLTRLAARASAREMRGLGFTSVLAPVADVTRGPADPVIGTRSACRDQGRSIRARRFSMPRDRGLRDGGERRRFRRCRPDRRCDAVEHDDSRRLPAMLDEQREPVVVEGQRVEHRHSTVGRCRAVLGN